MVMFCRSLSVCMYEAESVGLMLQACCSNKAVLVLARSDVIAVLRCTEHHYPGTQPAKIAGQSLDLTETGDTNLAGPLLQVSTEQDWANWQEKPSSCAVPVLSAWQPCPWRHILLHALRLHLAAQRPSGLRAEAWQLLPGLDPPSVIRTRVER